MMLLAFPGMHACTGRGAGCAGDVSTRTRMMLGALSGSTGIRFYVPSALPAPWSCAIANQRGRLRECLCQTVAQRSLNCQRGARRIPRCLLTVAYRSFSCQRGARRIPRCLFRAAAAVMWRPRALQQAQEGPGVSAGTPQAQDANQAAARAFGHCRALAASVTRGVLRSSRFHGFCSCRLWASVCSRWQVLITVPAARSARDSVDWSAQAGSRFWQSTAPCGASRPRIGRPKFSQSEASGNCRHACTSIRISARGAPRSKLMSCALSPRPSGNGCLGCLVAGPTLNLFTRHLSKPAGRACRFMENRAFLQVLPVPLAKLSNPSACFQAAARWTMLCLGASLSGIARFAPLRSRCCGQQHQSSVTRER